MEPCYVQILVYLKHLKLLDEIWLKEIGGFHLKGNLKEYLHYCRTKFGLGYAYLN